MTTKDKAQEAFEVYLREEANSDTFRAFKAGRASAKAEYEELLREVRESLLPNRMLLELPDEWMHEPAKDYPKLKAATDKMLKVFGAMKALGINPKWGGKKGEEGVLIDTYDTAQALAKIDERLGE